MAVHSLIHYDADPGAAVQNEFRLLAVAVASNIGRG